MLLRARTPESMACAFGCFVLPGPAEEMGRAQRAHLAWQRLGEAPLHLVYSYG